MLARCSAMTSDPQVIIRQGTLSGKYMKSRKGRKFCAFQGIPYAKPPVGELRFKSPQEPECWNGVRDAKEEGPKCIQMDFVTNECSGEEDCLYLNVYTPLVEKSNGPGLSVLVYVHGGAFFTGSGNTELYGPNLLLDHDVVFVTINYRLAVFGFLNLGTKDAPGNYGMKDQVFALRWVQKNIANFGGNPGCVTIFGESAGGASIHYLLLSPLTRGLFHRAIIQSGSANCDWALQQDAAKKGRDMAARLGCKQINPAALVASLRSLDARKLAEIELKLRTETHQLSYFTPSIEPIDTPYAFITEHPRHLLAHGRIANVPVMAGCTTHEGLMTVGILQSKGGSVSNELTKPRNFIPSQLQLKEESKEYNDIWQRIKTFYQQLEPNDEALRFVFMKTDVEFINGVDELVRGLTALRRSPVFYYSFSYDGGLGLMKTVYSLNMKGAAHADELGYLFSRDMIPNELESASSADINMIDRMTTLWVNFARTGNPTPDASLGVIWEPVVAPLHAPHLADTRYLDIGATLTMNLKSLNAKRMTFWQQLFTKHQQFMRGRL